MMTTTEGSAPGEAARQRRGEGSSRLDAEEEAETGGPGGLSGRKLAVGANAGAGAANAGAGAERAAEWPLF